MRVAVVVKSLHIGGMERAAINLAQTFANENHESHLIYFKDKNRALSPNEKVKVHLFDIEKSLKKSVVGAVLNIFAKILNGIIRHSYFYFQGTLLSPIFRSRLKELEKKYGEFDLIIVRGQGTFEMIWRYNSPNLIIQQVNILREYKTSLNDLFRQKIFADKNILCNAPSVYKELKYDFEKSRVRYRSLKTIPSPINIKLIEQKADQYKIDFDHQYIINIGRLAPVKNISLLIKAYAHAKKEYNLIHKLVIVGDGALKEDLKQQCIELNVVDDVHFTGALSNPYPWLKNADLFVFTSKNEGLPNVLLESLACQTEIIATRGRGGTLDIMSDGLETNLMSFEIEEIASKIVSTLQQGPKTDFAKHLQRYTPQDIVDQYRREYTECTK